MISTLNPVAAMLSASAPPTTAQRLPEQVWAPFMMILSWVSWAGLVICIAAFVVAGAMLAHHRRTAEGFGGDLVLVRIMVGAVMIGSATAFANVVVLS